MPIAIKINPKDNVVVALHPIAKGTAVPVDNTTVTAIEDIPQGHKMAIAPIKNGENIIKYGFPIGHATADAVPGTWMHTHNIHTNLSGEIEYSYHPNVHPLTPAAPDTFMGYRRKDGRAAIRNEIWIIPTVGCVNDCAKALVRDNQDLVTGSIDGLYTFTHPFGCSQTGHDHAQTRKLLASLVRHPNAGAVLVLSLGCENLTHEQFLAELGDYDHDRVKFLTCQDVEDELVTGREILKELAAYAAQFKREPIPASELVVGMKCGGSDGLSGITANPTIGRFSDMLCARGGSTVLTEVPEMFGAEGFLMDRCQNDAGGKVLRLRAEGRLRTDHGCHRLRRARHHQGPEHAVRPRQRPGLRHGADCCRCAHGAVQHGPRHAVWCPRADAENCHQQPAGRQKKDLDRLQRRCRRGRRAHAGRGRCRPVPARAGRCLRQADLRREEGLPRDLDL